MQMRTPTTIIVRLAAEIRSRRVREVLRPTNAQTKKINDDNAAAIAVTYMTKNKSASNRMGFDLPFAEI